MIKAVGVITKKKIIPITNGEINFPKKIPNLNQIMFKGVKISDLINPKIRKINETINRVILTSSPFKRG
jgi:hypothetical protein